MSEEQEEIVINNGAVPTESSKEKRIGCAHYKRRAKFVVRVLLILRMVLDKSIRYDVWVKLPRTKLVYI